MAIRIQNKTKFKSFNKKFKKQEKAAVKKAGLYLLQEVRKNASYPPFKTPESPYRIGGSGVPGRPWWSVARVTGSFFKSIRGYLRETKQGSRYTVDYGNKTAKHVKWVTQGTKVMFARDVILHTYKQPKVQEKINSILVSELKKGVK